MKTGFHAEQFTFSKELIKPKFWFVLKARKAHDRAAFLCHGGLNSRMDWYICSIYHVFNNYSSSPNGLWRESIAREAEGRMGYWLRGHEGERNNFFSKIQLAGQKYRE